MACRTGEGEEREEEECLFPRERKKAFLRCGSHADDELKSFRRCVGWLCVDQSNPWRTFVSWCVFLLMVVVIPTASPFILSCSHCEPSHRRTHDTAVQLSLSAVAAASFLSLSKFLRKYGLRRFLFLDNLCFDSEKVRLSYTTQLNVAVYKIWWYAYGLAKVPFIGNVYVGDGIACIVELASWMYRMSIFFMVCVLLRLICHLQILRLQDFGKVFQGESDVGEILREHLRVRKQLRVISHRFRAFILLSLLLVTASQFASLLITTKSHSTLTIFRDGDLAICSVVLMTGLLMCLHSAAKITHKAQSIVSLAAKWHICATCDSLESMESETTPTAQRIFPATPNGEHTFSLLDNDDDDDIDDSDENDDLVLTAYAQTASFQRREALVKYFEHNRAGISVFGFMLDRASLQVIFMIEMSLVLWILGKTVGI
ncbi:uncharacterized protein LOC18424876 isoform X2 [Amborella trichopoda]|uniref:uncharacterized protein LOC18424876 isoform X2 n=1 Tax=Amborella trichopoda TaxID=13333 RepID=UPI0009BFBC5C|nr:uncharacterized protein LOC18424876 isoform X2 [Amborella trichopoda]|eukprot:XP_020517432.1 uncharacterized protein LOC18424876 isoform X2 [Amborella trichopoda]